MFRPSKFSNSHEGPDFICVGMQKAGTGFLFDCLGGMNDFRMPIRKELHHFGRRKKLHPGGRKLLEEVAFGMSRRSYDGDELFDFFEALKISWYSRKSISLSGHKLPLDEANLDFLKRFSTYVKADGGDQAYLELFDAYRDHLTGDITPEYSILDQENIEHIKALLPDVKIILCVRDPVARLWSQFNMHGRRRIKFKADCPSIKDDIERLDQKLSLKRLQKMVEKDKFMLRSVTSEVYKKWLHVFGAERLLVINFEDLTRKTEPVLDKISDFFELQPETHKKIPGNKKQNRMKIKIDDERREFLNSVLGDEIAEFKRLFDEHRDRV